MKWSDDSGRMGGYLWLAAILMVMFVLTVRWQ